MVSETEIAALLVRLSADIEQYNREFDRATRTADRQTKAIEGHLGRAARGFKAMGAEVGRMALGFIGFGSAVAGASTVLTKMIGEAAGAEMANKRFAAQLNATGNASGKTVTQLNNLADQLKTTTLATEDGAKGAISQLLSFRSVAGDVFDETLVLAQDLAAAGFGTLSENAGKLGKALEDPEKGFKALRSAGVILSDTQETLIKSMEKVGDRLGAQRALLDAVRERVGGAGAAEKDTLIGAWHGLTEATNDWFESLGKKSGLVSTFTRMLNSMAGSMGKAAEAMGSKKGELAHLQEFAGRFNGNADPATMARIAQLKEEIELEEQVERIRAKVAERGAELAQVQIAGDIRVGESEAKIDKARKEYAEGEKTRKRNLADEKKKLAEQEAEDNRQKLLQMTMDEREFADDMFAIRARFVNEANSEGPQLEFILPAQVQAGLDRYQEGVDEMKAIDDEARRDMFDAWRDGWADLLDGNIKSFEQFADRLKKIGVQWAANHLAKESGKWANDALTAGFGEEGAARIKSAVKTIAAVASLATSFFGPRPSDRTEAVVRQFNPDGTVTRTERDLGPNKDSPENRAAVNKLDDAVMQFIGTLKQFNLNPSGTWAYTVSAGAGNSQAPFLASVNNSGERGFQTAEAAFQWVADQLVSTIGEVPERLQSLVDGFDGSNVEEFFNQLERYGNFDGTLKGIKDSILQLTDPKQYEIDQLDAWLAAVNAEAIALGYNLEELPEIMELYGLRLEDINEQYADTVDDVGDAVDDLAERARKLAAATDDAWSRVEARVRQDLDLRMETLDTQRAAIEENISAAERLKDAIHNAKNRFLTDPSLFRGSRGEHLNALIARLDETAAKAKTGDRQAQADLAEIAMAAAEANNQFNASSEEGVRIQNHIMDILNSTESYASSQLHIQEMALKANQDSVVLLQQLIDAVSGMGPNAGGPPDSEDFAGLVNSFVGSRNSYLWNGGTDSGFVGSDVYRGYESELFNMLGRTTDVGYLLSDLANARTQGAGTDPYAASSGRRVGVIEKRLGELGVQGFASGGWTGNLAQVHSGELLYTGPPAHVFSAKESSRMMSGGGGADALRADFQMLARTVSECAMDESQGLKSIAGLLNRMNSNIEAVLARA